MKFEEIIPLIREGKKIRRKSWLPDWPELELFNTIIDRNSILADDWEIIEND